MAVAESAGVLKDSKLFFDTKIDLALTAGTPTENGLEIEVSDLNIDELLTPYELTNHSGINVVKVVVKIPKLTTKNLRVTNIETVNVPADFQVELKTKALDITMRGPDYQLPYIKEADITVRVDFSDAAIGDGKFTATVTFTRYNQSFVVGSYVVNATVTPV